MRRREFLRNGSAGLLLPVALGSRSWAVPRTAAATLPAGALAIGYWHGGPDLDPAYDPLADSDATIAEDVVPAERLTTGDPALAAGSTVTVHGLIQAPTPLVRPRLESLSLTVHFRIPALGRDVGFLAWGHSKHPLPSDSPGVSFDAPAAGETALSLSVERTDAAAGPGDAIRRALVAPRSRVGRARFTVGSEHGRARLRPGVYFIAAADSLSTTVPAWRQCRFAVSGGVRRLVRDGLLGTEPVTFDYLVLSVARQRTESGQAA